MNVYIDVHVPYTHTESVSVYWLSFYYVEFSYQFFFYVGEMSILNEFLLKTLSF